MRDVSWVGTSLSDLKEFPEDVQKKIGYILQRVQEGKSSDKIKKLRSIRRGYSVYEIKSNHKGDTYRAVYLINLGNLIYVLHCFQKKSSFGIATPRKDLDLILKRLMLAREQVQKENENEW